MAVTYGSGSTGENYGFDAAGRSVMKIQQTGSVNYQTSATYNVAGEPLIETYPSGHTVTNAYDSAGRTTGVSGYLGDNTNRTYSTGILYSPFGALVKEQFGTTTAVYNKLAYNNRSQLAEIRVSTSYTGPSDTTWNRGKIINDYGTTDNNGNLKQQTVYAPLNDANTSSTSWYQQYGYDALNRVTQVHEYTGNTSLDWQQAYTYDRYGNRTINGSTSATWGDGINNMQAAVVSSTTTNRMYAPGETESSHPTMDYDAAGNQTKDTYTGAAVTRAYDAENRMTSGTQASSDVAGSYIYDGEGRRVKRVVGSVETWQVYGIGGELVAEYAASGAASGPQKEYAYRNGQLLVTLTSPLPGGSPSFSDNPLTVDVTTVQAAHITELRTAINALRAHLGMSAYSWTYSATTSDYISANPIIEMRTALDQAGRERDVDSMRGDA